MSSAEPDQPGGFSFTARPRVCLKVSREWFAIRPLDGSRLFPIGPAPVDLPSAYSPAQGGRPAMCTALPDPGQEVSRSDLHAREGCISQGQNLRGPLC